MIALAAPAWSLLIEDLNGGIEPHAVTGWVSIAKAMPECRQLSQGEIPVQPDDSGLDDLAVVQIPRHPSPDPFLCTTVPRVSSLPGPEFRVRNDEEDAPLQRQLSLVAHDNS